MNKEMMKKVVATKVVDIAVKTKKMPNGFDWPLTDCPFLFGKPKTKFDLTFDDYEELSTFMKR